MSNYLTGLAQLNPQVKRHNGGTATLTLDENGTTNATMLYVNGVAQTPGIDFNVSGTTLTCTSTLPAGTNIATTIQYFNTGIVNTVADDSIGLAQMASGVDGNLISYDASGNPAHVATGSAGQVLTSAGAGAPPTFATASSTSADEKLQAWCHIDASGTISLADSFNVTSVTDHGTGDHTVTWDTDFASVNYAFVGTAGASQRFVMAATIATGSVRFYVMLSSNGALSDTDDISIIASGDQ